MTRPVLASARGLWAGAHGIRFGAVHLRWSTVGLAAVVAAAALIGLDPRAPARLEFDRCAIAAGQWWRLLTGHLVHYGWLHLSADMGVFVALCWIAQRRARGTLWVVVLSAAAIGTAVYLCEGRVSTWRGMSGVDAALFGWVLVSMAFQDGRRRAGAYGGLLLLGAGRFVFETATGRAILPTSLPDGVAVVGLAHVIGLAVGCGLAALPALTRRGAARQTVAPPQAHPPSDLPLRA